MKLCLDECLRAVGLQHHIARFTSMGVHCAAHLSALTLEDFSILGIHSMDERIRLFNLIQMVKTLDLEYDYAANTDAGGFPSVDDDHLDPDKDLCDEKQQLNSATFDRSSHIRRQLDFSSESIEPHQELISHLTDGCHSHNKHVFPPGSAVVCGCGGDNNHRTVEHSGPLNHHITTEVNKTKLTDGFTLHHSSPLLSTKRLSGHQQKGRSGPAAAQTFGLKSKKISSKKELRNSEYNNNGDSEFMTKPPLIYESRTETGYNYGLPQNSTAANKKRQEGQRRICVCVRKRPLTSAESRRGETDVVTALSGDCVIVHESKEAVDLTRYILQHRFYFDQVFGEDSSNEEVYQSAAFPLVQHMLRGGKATCFAYGQTGAGKTHTMLGSSTKTPGLYALAVRDIFKHLSTSRTHTLVYVSFFEIYCGQLYDLLDRKKRVFAREDGQKVVHIAGLRDVRVESVNSLLEVISHGSLERTQGASGANPLSSRSHALLRIRLRNPNQQTVGSMWFVDLAGSERASDTKKPDRRCRMEGAEINQSLLALKECIRSLDQEQSHTPFRQSKLTQVLKDSFVGDSMTCMIANISPGHFTTEHTLNTLRYADRVKELTGQEGPRGRRKGKKGNSAGHHLHKSNSSSNFVMRGNSPSKKQRVGSEREPFTPAPSNRRAFTRDTNLCSTPKNNRSGTSAMNRKEVGLENITPIRRTETVTMRSRKEDGGEKKGRRKNSEKYKGSDQNISVGLPLWNVQRYLPQREYVKAGETLKTKEMCRAKQQTQVFRNTDEVEKPKISNLHEFDERDKERQRHLRWYHHQLQQFTPKSVSSSVNLLTPSSCPSFSSSYPATICSSPPSVTSVQQQDSPLPVTDLVNLGLENILDVYRDEADSSSEQLSFSGSGMNLQSELSLSWTRHNSQVEGRDAQHINKMPSEETADVTAERDGRDEHWAWVVTTGTEQSRRVTGARPANVAMQVSYSCHSENRREEGGEALNVTDDTAEGGERHRVFESPCQRAPAERPLSPGCEPANAHLRQNTHNQVLVQSKENRKLSNCLSSPLQNSHISNARSTKLFLPAVSETLPDPTPPAQVHNSPSVKARLSVSPLDETNSNSVNYNMDDIGISLLEVDQQVATDSFLQEEQQDQYLWVEDVTKEANTETTEQFVEDENEELATSFLELPKAKNICLLTSEPVHHVDPNPYILNGGKDVGCVKPEHPRLTKPKVKNCQKLQATPKCSTCASTTALSYSALDFRDTDSSTTNNEICSNATETSVECIDHMHNNTDTSFTSPQLESLVQNQTVDLFKQDSPVEISGQENSGNHENKLMIDLSTLGELDNAQCLVVQAHWEQFEKMEALFHKEGTLLCQQPEMTFREYVQKLEEIMEQKAQCVHRMRAWLQPYLKSSTTD